MTPLAVSLVEEDCETPTNYLSIIYNLPAGEKGKFAVCVKGMDFPLDDLSVRMVEWLEVLKALGADKIFLYNLDVHPNVRKVWIHIMWTVEIKSLCYPPGVVRLHQPRRDRGDSNLSARPPAQPALAAAPLYQEQTYPQETE